MAGPYEVPDIAGSAYGGFSRAMQDAQAIRTARQMDLLRRQQEAREAAEEARRADAFQIRQAADKLALRGQILGTVETPEDYGRVLPEIQRLGLPMGDLPEAIQSTAWETFRAQKPTQEARVAPSWVTQQWAPGVVPLLAPEAQEDPQLPRGPMVEPGIAPEEITASVQRAAERGLPIVQQSRMKDIEMGRSLQAANLQRNLDKDALSREWMAFQREAKIAGMNDAEAQRAFQREMQTRGYRLDVARFNLTKEASDRDAKLGPKFTADQTNAATFGRRVEQGLSDLDRVALTGYDPTTIWNSAKLAALVTSKPGANLIASPEEKQTAQAYRNIVNAILRRESGAVISPSEFANAQQQYFPSINDDQATRAQKRRNLDQALEGLKTGAGPAWSATSLVTENTPSRIPTEAEWNAAWGKAKPGDVVTGPDGKKYRKGGR